MVRKAAALGYRHIIRDTDVELTVAEEIGRQPRPEEFKSQEQYYDAVTEYTDALTETERYQAWYAETIEPTLEIAREVGNWYTGSVHVARAAGLRHARRNDRDLDDAKLLLASYGSGAQAEIHHETVVPGWEEEIAALNVDDRAADRYGSPSRSTSGSTTPTTTTPRPTSRNSPRPARSSSSTAGAAWASGSTGTFDN